MESVTFLNVGRADSAVLFLTDENGERRVIVIDGGSKNPSGEGKLAAFLDENHVSHIDFLLLTHLHQDHFGGFWHLIDRFTVGAAYLPYGTKLKFHPTVCAAYGDEEFHGEYRAVEAWLERIGTPVFDYTEAAEISVGRHRLSCLYPKRKNVRALYHCLDRLCAPELCTYWENTLLQFKDLCNASSAVWYLSAGEGEPDVLFGGDVSAQVLNQALAGKKIHPAYLKMQHHGFQTVHHGLEIPYFSREQFTLLHAENVIVSTGSETAQRVAQDSLPLLPPDTKLYFTYDGDQAFVL